ncbi:MAG: twin-arginine translocase subunit TatC [Bryobacteraceae bacterium]|nr:twin-arginine translocase subunit TatC [Bryobacteraceae bacterium]
MLRMSFLGHLEELRHRLIQSLYGLGVAFILAVAFAQRLWYLVQQPAEAALTSLGYPPELIFTSPMDAVMITWFKLPLLASVFIASPWVLYQAWSFIAPGLYKKERKLAVPFVISTAGLFILGGLFAYFIAFRFGLKFLLGVGQSVNIRPMITITEYFDIFVNVILGVGVVFELPVLIFMLTLLRITTPKFLLANSRYAILGIVIVAAVITPTPDVFNLMLFSLPMVLLYFVGIFASYLLVRSREGLRFPWIRVLGATVLVVLGLGAAGVWYAVTKMGYHTLSSWPFLTR